MVNNLYVEEYKDPREIEYDPDDVEKKKQYLSLAREALEPNIQPSFINNLRKITLSK